jgi:hypothetical protein
MENKESKPIILTPEEKALNEAIDRVYKKYGTDLPAFFRDVYNELTLKREESCDAADRRLKL